MTEKRFTLVFDHEHDGIGRIEEENNPIHNSRVVKILNEQHEQIQVLKAGNGEMEDYLARLEEENEQLKKQCKDFIGMLDDMSVAYLINDGLEEILND